MKPLGSVKRHYWLVKRMAETTGVDLVKARARGALPQADWANMVSQCQTCRAPGACSKWLDAFDTTADVAEQPDYCVNRDQLQALKQQALILSVPVQREG